MLLERRQCACGERFSASEALGCGPLSICAMDIGRLVSEVEHEPKLDAGVRHRQVDAIVPSHRLDLVETWMIVYIEHAPDLVIRPTAAALLLALRLSLLRCSRFYECPRHTTLGV